MKTKLLLLCALMGVLVACDKNANEPQQVAFRKGQQVTLRVDASLNQDVQAPRRVSGTIASDGALDFAWEEGDEIKVIVGGTPATFTMTRFNGASAEFTGAMPADGVSFEVTYTPANAPTATEIKNQTAANFEEVQTINKKYFSLEAKNCQLGNNISLHWIYSAVKVNLKCDEGDGLEAQSCRIVPSGTDYARAISLIFDEGQQMSYQETKSLYIIINDFTYSSTVWTIQVSDCNNFDQTAKILGEGWFKDLRQFASGQIYNLPILTLKTPEEDQPSEWD